jgi:hypothetical protein
MVSAPFPLNILHFLTASLLINMKSVRANVFVLHIYYFPIAVVTFVVFFFYQILILPLCYVKLVGHKFALMVKSPKGHKASTTLDRAGRAILFIPFGPFLLALTCIMDCIWFFMHLYKMDLERAAYKSTSGLESPTVDINRRTYKKMLKYFEQKNEQLVMQKRVAEDLRSYLDVMEGVKCLVYGRPSQIPGDKLGIYITYAAKFMKPGMLVRGGETYLMQDEDDGGEMQKSMEQVVQEFNVVK